MESVLNHIPHKKAMALIENIYSFENDNFEIGLEITEKSLLASEEGVPSYFGVEYMAQSIAAYNTYFLEESKRSKIGFMVSIRGYKAASPNFPIGSSLRVHVSPVLMVSNSGTFNCKILSDGKEVASGRITAYVPTVEELEEFKKGNTYE